jgi:hypothetical protein
VSLLCEVVLMGVEVVNPIEFEKRRRMRQKTCNSKKITVELDLDLYNLLRSLRDNEGLIIRHVINEGIKMKLREMGFDV